MISRLRWSTLGAIAVVSGTIALVALRWWATQGNVAPTVPFLLAGVLGALAALVLALGLRVRRAVSTGHLDDPVGAARVLALGQAAAITAAIHFGYLGAQAANAIPHLQAPEPREQLVRTIAAMVAAGALLAAGMLTQWWCQVPEDDDENEPPGGPVPG
ncbi:DUF3180 family protein [Ruania halotolerans]|uniref:DUF3180 family protein n=1 Tax=Ruania halotolerans TaxID=2897773 RepID=UPI001E546A25|nr:DUF3180 family protein [Ruania halotolerans]UFU07173.1 DUF3180 domain-containing protein [Ruania halotolerans]